MLLYPLDTLTMMGNNYIYRHQGLELEIIKDYEKMIGHSLKVFWTSWPWKDVEIFLKTNEMLRLTPNEMQMYIMGNSCVDQQ